MLVTVIKECVESFIRNFRLLKINRTEDVKSIVAELNLHGIAKEESFLSRKECTRYRKKIDALIESNDSNVWCDDEGADHRVYFINEVDELFQDFYEHKKIRSVLAAYVGTEQPKGMLLAAKIEHVPGNLGSGGGWHRDSPVTHQFKAICYLNDVTSENGPFQYIKQSHKKLNVLKNYFNKVFKPGQYRFSEQEIEHYLDKNQGYQVTDNTAKEGTLVFADTKGIHRGKPLNSGSRYVLFCYFWNDEIPSHFDELRQNR